MLPDGATTYTTTSAPAYLPQNPSHQDQQQYAYGGHYYNSYGSDDPASSSSVDTATKLQHEQFNDFDVAQDTSNALATPSSNAPGPSELTEVACRDDEGFLNPNVVLPLATRAAGPSNANMYAAFHGISPSPTPPLTRSGSVVSSRSSSLATPSPQATPHLPTGHFPTFPPHNCNGHGCNNNPMLGMPTGAVAARQTPPFQPQIVPSLFQPYHVGVPYGGAPQPAPQWQQIPAQQTPLPLVPTQLYPQAPRAEHGTGIYYNSNAAPQPMPIAPQQVLVPQTTLPPAPNHQYMQPPRATIKRPSAQSTSKTNALGGPAAMTKVYVCFDCPPDERKFFKRAKDFNRHHDSKHKGIRWYCPNPDCETNSEEKAPEERGVCRRDALRRHMDAKCPEWIDQFNERYPLKTKPKNCAAKPRKR